MIYKTKEKILAQDSVEFARELKKILESGEDVILDMSDTKYISSNGLRVILMNLKLFKSKGYDFSVINANDLVKEIFNLTGIGSLILLSDKDKSELKK